MGYFDGTLYYEFIEGKDDSLYVKSADKSCQEVNIPAKVKINGNSCLVTKIADRAFKECVMLESVIIPNTITDMGTVAFESAMGVFHGCAALSKIEIPNSVVTIGRGAFSGCKSLTSITIPNSVTTIGSCCFSDCEKLSSIKLSQNITRIELETFRGCSALTSIEIPAPVVFIGNYAFQGCSALEQVFSCINSPRQGSVSSSAFSAVYTATLYVPLGTLAEYKKITEWSHFSMILETKCDY